jgi:hypothetical protein
MVLLAPAADEGFVTMVSNAGLRARIRLSGDLLRATIVVTGVRRSGPATPVPREERTPLGR